MIAATRTGLVPVIRSEMTRAHIRRAESPLDFGTLRTLTLTLLRGKGQRFLDVDNAIAALKPCLDAAVDAGLIAGDSPKLARVLYAPEGLAQERSAKPGVRMVVTL
jgi:hypothetical protein